MSGDVFCLKGERLLSERRQIQIVGTQATSGCSKQEVQIRSQIAVTWEGKDARKERDKRNEKWRHIRRNNDIWFTEGVLNVVGFVTLRGPKRTVVPMVGMWRCATVLAPPTFRRDVLPSSSRVERSRIHHWRRWHGVLSNRRWTPNSKALNPRLHELWTVPLRKPKFLHRI